MTTSASISKRPFGPWDSWDDCLEEMLKRYDEETAKKVCGALKAELERRADYPWDECVDDMMDRYGDDEIARKVCGAIKAGNRSAGCACGARKRATRAESYLTVEVGPLDRYARTVPILASTPNPVDGEAITSWDLSRFEKNPTVLWGHDALALPIGKASDFEESPEGLKMRVRFARPEVNPLAEQVFQGVKDEMIKAVSVGYDPLGGGRAELVEVSFVSVGADEDAGTIGEDDEISDEALRAQVSKAASTLAKHRARAQAKARDEKAKLEKLEAGKKAAEAVARSDADDRSRAAPIPDGHVVRMDRSRLGNVRRTGSGGARIPARLTRTGVLSYRNPDGTERRELRLAEEVFREDSLATLEHATVIDVEHHTGLVTPEVWKDVALGHVHGVRRDGDFVASELVVQDADALERIDSGKLADVSCGYVCRLDPTPGVHGGQRYDCVQRDIRYNHVALCPPRGGRAGPEVGLRLDSNSVVFIDEQEETDMKTIRLDGRDYEVGSDAHHQKLEEIAKREQEAAVKKAQGEMQVKLDAAASDASSQKSRADKAEGERDAAVTALEQFKADASKAEAKAKEATAAKAKEEATYKKNRRRLERLALRFFMEDDEDEEKMDKVDDMLDAMSDRDLMLKVIEKSDPKFDPKDKSDDYVRSRFDAVVERAAEQQQGERSVDSIVRRAEALRPHLDSNLSDGVTKAQRGLHDKLAKLGHANGK